MFLGGGAATKTYVDDIFSTFLYTGNASARSINTGIDMTEGGLVWIKNRDQAYNHSLQDTVRGAGKDKRLASNLTSAQNGTDLDNYWAGYISSFNNNGFSIDKEGSGAIDWANYNKSGDDYAAFTFRKAPGFCDIKTWDGNSSAGRQIAHDLGCVPGLIMVKSTNNSGDWMVYHRGVGNEYRLKLNTTDNRGTGTASWNDTTPTSTHVTLGGNTGVNATGTSYVGYFFAGGESTAATATSVDMDTDGYLTVPGSSDFAFGTGAYTIECWIYYVSSTNYASMFEGRPDSSNGAYTVMPIMDTGQLGLYKSATASNDWYITPSSATALPKGQWTHVAIVREGTGSNQTKMYFNGQKVAQGTDDENYDQNQEIKIGAKHAFQSGDFVGKFSNYRVVKGTAVYTSSFRPPYEPLTNITNTKLLCCQGSSTTAATVIPTGSITATDTPEASTDSPFDDPAGFALGENGDQNVIKCGSYLGTGSVGNKIELGWEPSFIMFKNSTDSGDNWEMVDVMRGNPASDGTTQDARFVRANTTNAEFNNRPFSPYSTGFEIRNAGGGSNGSGKTYIYIALRRSDGYVGKTPDAGTDVFTIDLAGINAGDPSWISNFPVDMQFIKDRNGTTYNFFLSTRQSAGYYLSTPTNGAAISNAVYKHDYSNGWGNYASNDATLITSWMWKRHAGFDVVTYKGGGASSAPRSFAHSLAKTPEMIWTKNRSSSVDWMVWHKGLNGGGSNAVNYNLRLNQTDTQNANGDIYGGVNNVLPTSTHWTTGGNNGINENGSYFTAILFASVSGISKVGYYDGSDSNQTITTDFQTRFLIIKNITTSGEGHGWYVFDTVRGWDVSSSVKILTLDTTSSESDTLNMNSNPTSTGFTLTGNRGGTNDAGQKYIYYAHA